MIYTLSDIVMVVFFSTLVLSVLLVVITYLALRRMFIGTSLMQENRVYTILKCPLCSYTIKRLYKIGDYIGKTVQETCPTHGVNLVIHDIFREASSE